jgi:integrase
MGRFGSSGGCRVGPRRRVEPVPHKQEEARPTPQRSRGGVFLKAVRAGDPRVLPWNHRRETLWEEFHRLQKAAGIDLPCLKGSDPGHVCRPRCHTYGFHDLRRAHATYNYEKVPDRAPHHQMGHASFQTTQGYIKHAELRQADAYPAHLPVCLQNGEVGAKQRKNTGEDGGEPKLRVVAA